MATATAPLETTRTRRVNNAVWFELPVADLNRAVHFYEATLAVRLKTDARFPGLAMFPRATEDAVTGALIESGNGAPSIHGTVIYLNCDGDLDGNAIKVRIGGNTVAVCCELCAQALKEADAWASGQNPGQEN